MTTGLRTAESINQIFEKLDMVAPFTDGTHVNVSIAPAGDRGNMVVNVGQATAIDAGGENFGRFGTRDIVPDQEYARGPLAITPAMKTDVSRVVGYETTGKPVVQVEGEVGPQAPASAYPGGGNQIFYDFPKDGSRLDYFQPTGPTQPLPARSVNPGNTGSVDKNSNTTTNVLMTPTTLSKSIFQRRPEVLEP